MQQKVYYVTSNRGKVREAKRLTANEFTLIKIIDKNAELEEIQTFDEKTVIEHKAQQAWNAVQGPCLVDDAGFYLKKYGFYPGTLAKPTAISLGWEGIYRLIDDDNRVTIYCRICFTEDGINFHHFRADTEGEIITPPSLELLNSRGFASIFKPSGSKYTYLQMAGKQEANEYYHRTKALKKFFTWYEEQVRQRGVTYVADDSGSFND
ncbi:hypothetical protein FJ366_02210 [Candidatus Dependentiae bacterium]|nr:hypothetical protein [Candidatus Dependentiae bacterium]